MKKRSVSCSKPTVNEVQQREAWRAGSLADDELGLGGGRKRTAAVVTVKRQME